MLRVILDTNVWTYLSEQGSGNELLELSAGRSFEIEVPPATIVESARTPKDSIRGSLLELLGDRRLHHPRPEAALQAEEWIALAKTRGLSWLRLYPERSAVRKLDRFWTVEVPAKARDGANWPFQRTRSIGDVARAIAKDSAKDIAELRSKRDSDRLNDWYVTLDQLDKEERIGFLPSDRVELWRCNLANLWWYQLITLPAKVFNLRLSSELSGRVSPKVDTTLADWTAPWINVEKLQLDRAGWNRFWYCDVEVTEVPRNWLRWAIEFSQPDFRIGKGTGIGGDQQLCAHLIDVDLFISCDRPFTQTLEAIRPHAPFEFAAAVLLPYDPTEQLTLVKRAIELAPQI